MSGSEASYDEGGEAAVAAQETSDSLKKIGKIVNNLSARADCIPFREAVDWKGLQLYDYPKIISKMMDLGTIKKKLDKGKYTTAAIAADDIRLVWNNCMTYNADGSDFYRLAESYSKRFEERYQKLTDEFGEEIMRGAATDDNGDEDDDDNGNRRQPVSARRKSRANSFTTSSGRTTPIPNNSEKKGVSLSSNNATPAGAAASSKKVNKQINYEAMGIVPLDVRTRFAARLQRLSGMELGHVLQAIDVQCPNALEDPTEDQLRSDAPPTYKRHCYSRDEFDGGCQIEVDVDAIPSDTFWELDSYVKEKVQGRGRGVWSEDVTEPEVAGKKRRMKSF